MRKISINVCTLAILLATVTGQSVIGTSTEYGQGCGEVAESDWLDVPDRNIPFPQLDPIKDLQLRTSPTTPPVIGTTVRSTVVYQRTLNPRTQTTLSFVMMGYYPLYGTLGGDAQCTFLQSMDYIFAPLGPVEVGGMFNSTPFSVAIPNSPALVGVHIYLQAGNWALNINPGSPVFDNLLTSNGVDWLIGNE